MKISKRSSVVVILTLIAAGGVAWIVLRGELRSAVSQAEPPMRLFTGHTDAVDGIAFAPDGDRFATASRDGSTRVWDLKTAKETLCLVGHVGNVTAVTFSADGNRIATGGEDGDIIGWDANTGDMVALVGRHKGIVTCLAFLPDGTVISGGHDGTVRRWNLDDEKLISARDAHAIAVYSVTSTKDGAFVLSASADGKLVLWDMKKGSIAWEHQIPDAPPPVTGLIDAVISPDGAYFYTLNMNGLLQEWKTADHELLRRFETATNLRSISVHDNGRILACAGPDIASVYDMRPKQPALIESFSGQRLWQVAIHPRGRYVVGGPSGTMASKILNVRRQASNSDVPVWRLSETAH